MRGLRLKSILISAALLTTISCGTTKTIVKREFVIPNSPRYQAVVDSLVLRTQALKADRSECEAALKAWMKFEEIKVND